MKVIVVLEVDPDAVIEAHHGDQNPMEYDGTIASAVQAELGWVEQSGIHVVKVCEPDDSWSTVVDKISEHCNE